MRNILFFGLILLVCCIGCGKSGYHVGGTVTFPDGKPVPRGQVTFNSPSFTGGGGIIGDGTYSISVVGGVPAGTYTVTVRAMGDSPSDPNVDITMQKPAKSLIDPKYNDPATSGLTCEVKGITTFDITVEAPK